MKARAKSPAKVAARAAEPATDRHARTIKGARQNIPAAEKQKRKERVLSQGALAATASIADAVVIKNENVFFLTAPSGEVPLTPNHGYGLYYHDCRYLNGYILRIADTEPTAMISDARAGSRAVFELTNSEIEGRAGQHIRKDDIGVRWERVLDGARCALHDVFEFHNYGLTPIRFPVALTFQAQFEDIFTVRGMVPERLGKLRAPAWRGGSLTLGYDGADKRYRGLAIGFEPAPQRMQGTTAQFELQLQPRERKQLRVVLQIEEESEARRARTQADPPLDLQHLKHQHRQRSDEWLSRQTHIESDSVLLNAAVERSLRDLHMLQSTIEDWGYFAAGLPWFGTLFGRDSVITALQTLSFNPQIAAGTLRVLAHFQGQRVDEWRDEQPGKILHELRVGELARLGEVPHNPYYGTVDATPLFLMLFSRYAAWTGDLTLFQELKEQVERALAWIDRYGDSNGDGYVDYQSASNKGLSNQGWKDSGDSIVNADGSLAQPPIALVEVQGYVYAAKLGLADLFARAGDPGRANALRQEAEKLKQQFARDFWLDDLGFFALALERGGKPCAVVSSNPGQALWTGIIDPARAKQTVGGLLADDMFSGWGIRTLSAGTMRYNPLGYHLGTVWPHDNSLIAAGLRRYGFDAEFQRVFQGIVETAMDYSGYRLPELFAGFAQRDYSIPVRYPVACHPQAWAAGAIPFLLETELGLQPDAFAQRLNVVRPLLPDYIHLLQVKHLSVGSAHVDLQFERQENGRVDCHVLHVEGKLDVAVEQ